MRPELLCLLSVALGLAAMAAPAQPLVLVQNGASRYAIYRAANAPEPVQEAARELARVVETACGVKLPVVDRPQSPMICLGDNAAVRAAGLDVNGIPEEGYVITARDGNLFILGPDTPDGELTVGGGCSQGTLFGVYEFLERFLNARWLMPGEVGEDIPPCRDLRVEGLPVTGQPDHPYRYEPYIQEKQQAVKVWTRRLRLGEALPDGRRGCSVWMAHNHVWDKIPGPAVIEQHPEYAALVGGQRVKPADRTYKLCTTNPGLIQAFADGLMARMAENPQTRMFTISPTDGQGWCECPGCTALDEPIDGEAWPGSRMLPRNMTRRICTFYNAVARLVRAKYPDKLLGGYLYYEYAYPPRQPMAMEPNLSFVIATRAYYGMTLYRPELAAEFPRLMAAWSALLPGRVAYYDLPTKLIHSRVGFIGAPQPAGVTIFKTIFPALKQHDIRGILLYGDEWWGTAAAHNYLIAKLMWNHSLDPAAVREEWLTRAYGAAAATPMRQLDELLDTELSKFKQNPNDWQWRFPAEAAKQVYAPQFAQIERLYAAALAQVQTPRQRARLEMFGDNLVVLHWNLRHAGLLPEPEKSSLYRSDEAYARFADDKCDSVALMCSGADHATRKASLLKAHLAPGQ
ncbi:DUF4838 domain-containing protein [bacterium]|nr:DUF4838 domain-containing protein [bacterium]